MPKLVRWEVLEILLKDRNHEYGVEVGVNRALNLFGLYKNLPNLKTIIGIDPYSRTKEQKGGGNIESYQQFITGLSERYEDTPPKISYLCLSSEEASNLFKDEIFDWVFIDADHHYESVKLDISLWLPKVKKRGIVAGHDYNNREAERNWGVAKAVHEAFESTHTINIEDNCVWWIEK